MFFSLKIILNDAQQWSCSDLGEILKVTLKPSIISPPYNISYDPDPWMTLLLWLRPEHVKMVQSKVIGP